MFGYHSKQRITLQVLLLALHLPRSHTEAIIHVPLVTYTVREKGMENKSELHDASNGAAAVGKKAHLQTK